MKFACAQIGEIDGIQMVALQPKKKVQVVRQNGAAILPRNYADTGIREPEFLVNRIGCCNNTGQVWFLKHPDRFLKDPPGFLALISG
jgi:hypothetical protein